MPSTQAIPVTADNFVRAESDMYFGNVARQGGFGKFFHNTEPAPIQDQTVIRLNRDTLYSGAVFDLDAGPVTLTLPDPGERFLSMQVFDEDEFVVMVVYGAGKHTLTKEKIGTRYALAGLRILVDPADPKDLAQVHALQNAVKVEQKGSGKFEVPNWDPGSQKNVRQALLALGTQLPDSRHMFGMKDDPNVDPVRHLIGAAMAWGGNPEKEATYLNVTPSQNDGKAAYLLNVKDVPVDGFWSVIVYDKDGYIPKNDRRVYSFNNLTAKKDPDGSVSIQFGGDPAKARNCIPIVPGWNYMVRLYRPRAEILKGSWKFPQAQIVQ
jgi:hypothetical protein